MDIGGIATPVTHDPSKQRTGDTVSVAVKEKSSVDTESDTPAHIANNVVDEGSEIPAEKLPPHLGRNLNVTA